MEIVNIGLKKIAQAFVFIKAILRLPFQ